MIHIEHFGSFIIIKSKFLENHKNADGNTKNEYKMVSVQYVVKKSYVKTPKYNYEFFLR